MNILDFDSVDEWQRATSYDDRLTEASGDDFMMLHQLDKYLEGVHGFIAGGAFKYIFEGKKPKDVDIYFTGMKEYSQAVAKLSGTDGWRVIYQSEKVDGFQAPDGQRVELIKSMFDTPKSALTRFDFTITKFAYWIGLDDDKEPSGAHVLYHRDFFQHLTMKRLVIDSYPSFPLDTYNRAFRYAGYGFRPCRETKYILARLIQKSALTSPDDITNGLYEGVD